MVTNKDIHKWYKKHDDDKYFDVKYVKPMLKHRESVKEIKTLFKNLN